jgi:hypothetical protein
MGSAIFLKVPASTWNSGAACIPAWFSAVKVIGSETPVLKSLTFSRPALMSAPLTSPSPLSLMALAMPSAIDAIVYQPWT